MKTIIETRKVWISDYIDPEEAKAGNTKSLIISDVDMSGSGWSVIGSAAVEIELFDNKTMVSNKVASLEAQLKDEMAATQIRQLSLRKNISELLAITCEVAA